MLDKNLFDDLAKNLANAMPDNVQAMKADLEKHFKNILQQSFAKLDLIPRDEFEVQTKVLAKTREKLEALEERVTILEQQLKNRD